MLWEIEIRPAHDQVDREGERILHEARNLHADSITQIASARSFLIQSDRVATEIERAAERVVARSRCRSDDRASGPRGRTAMKVCPKPPMAAA